LTLVSAGRVGRPHGRDGSFWVEGASDELASAGVVTVAGRSFEVERRGGTAARPLIRLAGVRDPRELGGEPLLVDAELAEDEWLAADLIGREVVGLGRVRRVLAGPSCDLLELDDGTLVPFVGDAVRAVEEGAIHVDREFLGL
jgi:16S rRNA processing protein RimM